MLALGLAAAAGLHAAEDATALHEVLDKLSIAKAPTAEEWTQAAREMGRPAERARLITALGSATPEQLGVWVGLLEHADLAVRLGALELLEDMAGDDFQYDPWEPDPALRAAGLEPWKRWLAAGGRTTAAPAQEPGLPAALMEGYIRDLMTGDAGRVERVHARLQTHAQRAAGALETFISNQTALPPGMRARLKEAQYRLILETASLTDERRAARMLALGTRDERVEGLALLMEAGSTVLPIVTEMLADAEPLVRERAVDVLLAAGGSLTLDLLARHLATEKDTAVQQAAIRGLGKLDSAEGIRLLQPYLKSADEDIVTSALLSLSLLGSKAGRTAGEIAACLKHPSWRVRGAALQCIGKARITSLQDQVLPLVEDTDSFVRSAAVDCLANTGREKMGMNDATARKLLEAYNKHDDLKIVVLRALRANGEVPDSIVRTLPSAPPHVQAASMSLLEWGRNESMDAFLLQAARSENPDIALPALRKLAASAPEHPGTQGLFIASVMGPDAARRNTVLENLAWPRRGRVFSRQEWERANAALDSTPGTTPQPAAAKSLADEILAAFTAKPAPAPAPAPAAEAPAQTAPGGLPGQPPPPATPATLADAFVAVARSAPPTGKGLDSQTARRAMMALVGAGDPRGPEMLAPVLAQLDVQDRAETSEMLASSTPRPIHMPLWRTLLRDPSREVRLRTFRHALDMDDSCPLPAFAITELAAPGCVLQPLDVLDSLHHLSGDLQSYVLSTAKELLAPGMPAEKQILALIMLAGNPAPQDADLVKPLLKSPAYWTRRAAAFCLAQMDPAAFQAALPELAKDPSAWVREAAAAGPGMTHGLAVWRHHLNDTTSGDAETVAPRDYQPRRSLFGWSMSPAAGPEEDVLRHLAKDPEERVRLAAAMSLITQRREVDVKAVKDLMTRSPDADTWQEALSSYLQRNYQSMGPALKPLVSGLKWNHIRDDQLQAIERHFGLKGSGPLLTTFAELAAKAPQQPAKTAGPQFLDNPSADGDETSEGDTPFTVVFFHNPGCAECETTRRWLTRLKTRFPRMTVKEHNIRDTSAVLLHEALSDRFSVPAQQRLATPAVFFQHAALIKEEISMSELMLQAMAAAESAVEDGWDAPREAELSSARATVTERYQNRVTLLAVAGAGLLDGINPCAFATMIFFLSYLQVARRTPAEILAVGMAFVASVFVTYFLLGLGLVEVVARVDAFKLAGRLLSWALAISCLVIAQMSFRDAKLADQGRLGEMSLQLPGFLKDHIRGVIRTGARSRRFILAAALAGVVVSTLELACTGQVYLPTIVYALKTGTTGATGFLLVYNLAFIVPLLLVFILAWRGMKSEALIRFQQRRTGLVKRLLGLLFLGLFLLLVFSGRL